MRQLRWISLGILALLFLAVFTDNPSSPGFHFAGINVSARVVKGLDLAGGVRILYCAKGHPNSAAMGTARDIIENRAAGGLGATEPQVSVVNGKCIDAELPGTTNAKKAIQVLGTTGKLVIGDSGVQASTNSLAPGEKVRLTTTKPANINAKPPLVKVIVPGSAINQGSAVIAFNSSNQPEVDYTIHGSPSTAWCNYTTNHVGSGSPIVLDGRVVSDPSIQGAICGGSTSITGVTLTEANQLKTYLNYGAIPVALHVDSSQQVSATLGPEYVHKAIVAFVVGMILVALFMLTYYRLPGLLADLALIIYALIVFALFKIIPVTLTLAGIAGFILSIGMAVDANVLIFERLKEELRAGKTLGAAINSGFNRAWTSIRDSNISTMITTAILYWFGQHFGTTIITGFATTLFLGVAVSMFTAIIVTRTFLRLLVASGRGRSLALYGVEERRTEPAVAGGSVV